jgi:hypothetical protein
MLVGIHSLKRQVAICGISPIILYLAIDSTDPYDQYAAITVSGSQPINWFDTYACTSGTIANNTPLLIGNIGYGFYTHCVTFTNSYGSTGTSFDLYRSDPSP